MAAKKKFKLNRLKDVLKNQGRHQRWLSQQMGINEKTISFWCNNLTQPDVGDLHELAEILSIAPAELIGDGEEIIED